MATMTRSVFPACFFLLLLTQTAWGQLYNAGANITPPTGNSPKIVSKTVGAYFVYICKNGEWVRIKGYAKLVDEKTGLAVGTYAAEFDDEGYLGIWTLINDAGDSDESGYSSSVVTGRLLAAFSISEASIPDYLVQATSHENSGAASAVSYIQIYNVVGGNVGGVKASEKCSSGGVTVSFSAEFCLWTQDVVPAPVPGSLWAPGRFVQNFFAAGSITYKFEGSVWVEIYRAATLYTIPGTPALGSYWLKNGVESWTISGSNGLVLYGTPSAAVHVSPNACAWHVSKCTSASGALTSLGTFSHVQTLSTNGGSYPAISKPATGTVSAVSFTCIFNFYVSP